MAKKYIAFDIETAKIVSPHVKDLKSHRPLGITCAATYSVADGEPRLWHGGTDVDSPTSRMSQSEAAELVQFLLQAVEEGETILTWNGLSFDFDILAEESGMVNECRQLAREHVDMMFHLFCVLGYPVGLESASRGMGLPGKSAAVAQHLAPELWAAGKTAEVFEYVSQDVRATMDLALACERKKKLRWITQRGKPKDMPLKSGWMTVQDAAMLPQPDTSWMDRPMKREKFIGWLSAP